MFLFFVENFYKWFYESCKEVLWELSMGWVINERLDWEMEGGEIYYVGGWGGLGIDYNVYFLRFYFWLCLCFFLVVLCGEILFCFVNKWFVLLFFIFCRRVSCSFVVKVYVWFLLILNFFIWFVWRKICLE